MSTVSIHNTQRNPYLFFGLVLLFSLPFWAFGALAKNISLLPANLPVGAFMAICPILAALTLVHKAEGKRGTINFLRRIWTPPKQKRWYLVALLAMPVVMTVCYFVMRLTGLPLPEPQFAWLSLPYLLLLFLGGGIGEEAGWTGYALEPLQAKHGTLKAILILGIFGSLWHLVPLAQGGHALTWVAWQWAIIFLTRFPTVWLYNAANRSLLVVILFHAMDNVSFALFPNNGSHYDPAIKAVVLGGMIAIFILVSWRRSVARSKVM